MRKFFLRIYKLRKIFLILSVILIAAAFFWRFTNQYLYKTKASEERVNLFLESNKNVLQNKRFFLKLSLVAEVATKKISGASFLLKYDSDNRDLIEIDRSVQVESLSVNRYFDEVLIEDLGRQNNAKLARITYLRRQNESNLENSTIIFFPFKTKQKQGETAVSIIKDESQVVGPIQNHLFTIASEGDAVARIIVQDQSLCENNNQCGANALCQNNQCACNSGYYNCNVDWADGCESNQVCQFSPTLNQTSVTGFEDYERSTTEQINPTPINADIRDTNLIAQPSRKLYAPVVVRGWASAIPGRTQWTHLILSNPNNREANIDIKVYSGHDGAGKRNGDLLSQFTRQIPRYGKFSTLEDPVWNNLPDNSDAPGTQTFGWAEITSDQPIIGISRLRFLDGNQPNSNRGVLIVDTNLQTQPSLKFYSKGVLMNVLSAIPGKRHWSFLIISNPNDREANVTIKVYSGHDKNRSDDNGPVVRNGDLLSQFTRRIPRYGTLSTFGDPVWNNLPDNSNAPGRQTIGWAEITSDQPIIGVNRLRFLDGETPRSPGSLIFDTNFDSLASTELYSGLLLNNWPSGILGKTQWNSFAFYNTTNNETSVTIQVYSGNDGAGITNGQLIKTIQKTIGRYGAMGTLGDNDWINLPDNSDQQGSQTYAWIKITSSRPIFGANRFRLHDGNNWNSPASLLIDNNLQTQPSRTLYSAHIVRNVETVIPEKNQSNDLILFNTTNNEANVTIKVYSGQDGVGKINGDLLSQFTRKIPPYGRFSTFGDNDWNNLPDNSDAPGTQTFGWAEITSDQPIIGINRLRFVNRTANPTPPGSITLNLRIKLQGVMRQPNNEEQKKARVKVRLIGGNLSSPVSLDVNFNLTNNRNADTDALIWEGTVNLPGSIVPGQRYNLLVKGPKHIQKKICVSSPSEAVSGSYRCQPGQGITFSPGQNNLDFSRIYLLAGDLPVNGVQDGVVDSLDTSYIRNKLGKSDSTVTTIADLNLDGIVDSQDWSIVLYALSVKTDEE